MQDTRYTMYYNTRLRDLNDYSLLLKHVAVVMGKRNEWVQHFVGEASWKLTIQRSKEKWENNIKIGVRGKKAVGTRDDTTGPFLVVGNGIRSVEISDCTSINTDVVVSQSGKCAAGNVQNTKLQK
jgi:hypothetical protein